MRRKFFPYCALAILLLAAGCGSPDTTAADRVDVKLKAAADQQSRESRETVRAKKLDTEEAIATGLPPMGVMVAFIRWGVTTVGVFDVSSRKFFRLAAKETGPLVFSLAGDRLAYLVREETSPAKNYIEILDWRSRRMLVVEPASNYALLGFALDPEGKKLVYAALNIRASRSTDVTWRVGLADLERSETQVTLTSSSGKVGEHGIPVPFEWSRRSGRIYLQGWLPFRGMIKQSIWALSPDGSQLTKIIPEPSYTGIPRLSPDGSRLSYLAADMDSLPRDYVAPPGPPPGNVLSVMDLAGGETAAWARGKESAFGAYAWSANGEEVLAVEQAWLKGRFRDVEMRRIGKAASVSVAKIDQAQSLKEITGIQECRDRALLWIERERGVARLHAKTERGSEVLFNLPEGEIQFLGCLNR